MSLKNEYYDSSNNFLYIGDSSKENEFLNKLEEYGTIINSTDDPISPGYMPTSEGDKEK